MSTTPIQSASSLQDLARVILQNFDANRDGQLGVDEFASLLSRLATGVAGASTSAATAATTPVLTLDTTGRTRATLSGYSERKLANLDHRSPKYLFARVAMWSDLSTIRDKASAEQFLRGLLPELQAAGLDVKDVKGDKIQIVYEGHDVWIDVIRGANSGKPALQWLPVS